jgi:hypothetical protein
MYRGRAHPVQEFSPSCTGVGLILYKGLAHPGQGLLTRLLRISGGGARSSSISQSTSRPHLESSFGQEPLS